MFYILIILQNKSNNLDDFDDLYKKSLADLAGLLVVSFIAAFYLGLQLINMIPNYAVIFNRGKTYSLPLV